MSMRRMGLLFGIIVYGCSACTSDVPATITVRYGEPALQAEYERVLEKNGVAFSHVDQNGQKAVRIEGLSAQELVAINKEFDDWMRTRNMQSGNQ